MMPSTIHILLVEDDEDDVVILQDLLKDINGSDFEVDWVRTHMQATQHLSQHSYDIHLFDYRLGLTTGLDLIQHANTLPSPAPSILLTGIADRHVDLLAAQTGAVDFLVKGELTPSNLERSIRYAIERRRAETEREALASQLMETSRQLGMAEVAANVLHNVGNVLNSINVSASLIFNGLRAPYVDDIRRIALMLKEHDGDLETFLTQDSQGCQLLPYLDQSTEHVIRQHATMLHEIQYLTTNLEHVKHIIQAQHPITRSPSHYAPVDLSDVMDQALHINQHPPSPYKFEVERHYADIPPIMSDKHQILQILVNLIKNAKQAMQDILSQNHTLTLSIRGDSHRMNMVQLSVQDTGAGIAPDHLTKIFSQRFTTKREGDGLGLHSSALAAEMLKGTLKAQSEGEGQGALFTLSLPVSPVEARA